MGIPLDIQAVESNDLLYIVITGEEIKRIGGLPLDRFFLDLLESESSGPQWRPLI